MIEIRRLAAIMFTDIVGYTAIMNEDDEATRLLLETCRQIQRSLLQKYQGTLVREMGDGVICVFGSTTNAVKCAIEIQIKLREEKDLNLKIAIHSGEIIEKENDVFGDGVNVAISMGQCSQANVILLSDRVNTDISNVKSIMTRRLGVFELKNVDKPMALYAVACRGMSFPTLKKSVGPADLNYSTEELMSDDEKFLRRVRDLIQRELTNPKLSIPFMAEQLGLSRSKLYRKIMAVSGQSPGQLINEVRLEKAAKLLENRTGNVSQIAYECGFNTLSYFSKIFQERFSKTPSDYMKAGKLLSNLPAPMHEIIGREKELADLQIILRKSRLITITGTGGTGKTRLAVELLRRHGQELAPNTCFVQLAPVTESNQVVAKIAQTLELKQSPRQNIIDSVVEFLEVRETIMVLDNFEHVLDAASDISFLLSCCTNLRIVVTSRINLNIKGEVEYALYQLPLPEKTIKYTIDELLKLPSIALFVDRVRQVKPAFELDEKNRAAACEICIKLDGLPLALELAAARVKLFSCTALLERLANKLDLLSTSSTDRPERHRTLRNAINWSYNLLTPDEQTLFRRLSVFAGGCTLEAAAQVCFEGYADRLEILDKITSLLDKSLLQKTNQKDGEPRFYMLETIKDFGQDRLARSMEEEEVTLQYIDYYRHKFKEVRQHLTGPEMGKWLDLMSLELDNLRSVLLHCEKMQLAKKGQELVLGFYRYWTTRSMMPEGLVWIERILDMSDEQQQTSTYCDLLNAYAHMFGMTRGLVASRPILLRSLEIARKTAYNKGLGTVLNHLGWLYTFDYDYDQSCRYNKESLQVNIELKDDRAVSVSYSNQGWIERMKGELEKSREMFGLAGKYRKKIGDLRGYAWAQTNRAWVDIYQGNHSSANTLLEKALDTLSDLEDSQLSAWASTVQCYLFYYAGDFQRAIEQAGSSLHLWLQAGNMYGPLHLEIIPYLSRLEMDDLDFAPRKCRDIFKRSLAISDLNSSIIIPYGIALGELKSGNFALADAALKELFEFLLTKRAYLYLPRYLELSAFNFHKMGREGTGVQFLSLATRLRKESVLPIQPVYRERVSGTHSSLLESMPPGTFEQMWLEGQKMSVNSCLEHFEK